MGLVKAILTDDLVWCGLAGHTDISRLPLSYLGNWDRCEWRLNVYIKDDDSQSVNHSLHQSSTSIHFFRTSDVPASFKSPSFDIYPPDNPLQSDMLVKTVCLQYPLHKAQSLHRALTPT